MPLYQVHLPLSHNNRDYTIGATIELFESVAAPLVALGTLFPVGSDQATIDYIHERPLVRDARLGVEEPVHLGHVQH